MADSIADIAVTSDDWVDVSALTGILVGSEMIIQNKGIAHLLVWIGATKPTAASTDGPIIYDFPNEPSVASIAVGEKKVWLKAVGAEGKANVQAV